MTSYYEDVLALVNNEDHGTHTAESVAADLQTQRGLRLDVQRVRGYLVAAALTQRITRLPGKPLRFAANPPGERSRSVTPVDRSDFRHTLYRFRAWNPDGPVAVTRYYTMRPAVDRQVKYWAGRGLRVTVDETTAFTWVPVMFADEDPPDVKGTG